MGLVVRANNHVPSIVRYFFLADEVAKNKLRVMYCPTDKLVAYYMTKPLQGWKLKKSRTVTMGLSE